MPDQPDVTLTEYLKKERAVFDDWLKKNKLIRVNPDIQESSLLNKQIHDFPGPFKEGFNRGIGSVTGITQIHVSDMLIFKEIGIRSILLPRQYIEVPGEPINASSIIRICSAIFNTQLSESQFQVEHSDYLVYPYDVVNKELGGIVPGLFNESIADYTEWFRIAVRQVFLNCPVCRVRTDTGYFCMVICQDDKFVLSGIEENALSACVIQYIRI